MIALSHGFFPSTEQKYVLNTSALSVLLHLTVLTGYILFLMYLKSSFLVLKRPEMSLYKLFSLCLCTLSQTIELRVLFFFFSFKHFALWSVCSISLQCARHFGWHGIGGTTFLSPSVLRESWLSDCIVSVLCGQHGIWRITHLVFGERTRKGRSHQYLIKGEILPLQKASAKQICFASPNLDVFLLIKDRVRRATSPQPLVQSSLIRAPTSYHMMVTANMLFFPPLKCACYIMPPSSVFLLTAHI